MGGSPRLAGLRGAASAGARALGHRSATVSSGADSVQVKATAKAKRWLTARLARGPRHTHPRGPHLGHTLQNG
jgi:hypothetical protein